MNTRWRWVVLLGALLWPCTVLAQSSLPFTFHTGATATGNGTAMQADYFSTVHVQIEGTFVGTLVFEGKTKDASGYALVQCTNRSDASRATETDEPGYWDCPGGAFSFRVRVSAYTSGTIVVTGTGTTAVSGRGGGGGVAQGLDANFDIQPTIDGATSAKPLVVWNGIQGVEILGDPTLGGIVRPKPLADTPWSIWPNFNGCIRDMEANGGVGADMLCFDPDAATPRARTLWKTGYFPLKSFDLPAGYWDGDGTNCPAQASVVTINSGPKLPTFVCADSSSAILHATVTLPDDYVAGTTIKVRQYIVQTAANTGSVLGDVSAQCRGNAETLSSTWGTAVAIDLASSTGSNAVNSFESGAITPAGTCNPGDLLSLRYVFDAASTGTSASLHFVNFKVFYSSESLSH